MNCELNKFRESVYEIAGVDKTSAIRMKSDMLFLPQNGKYGNKQLKNIENSYKWGEYIRDKINETYNNQKGFYGNLIDLDVSNIGDKRQGTYVYINFTPQLQKAIDYKNKLLDEQAYKDYLEYEAYKSEQEVASLSLDAEHNIIEDKIRSGEITMHCALK